MIRTPTASSSAFRWYLAGSVTLGALFALPLLPLPAIASPSWAAFVGRLHPIAVHFPVALIPLLTLFELVASSRRTALPTLIRTNLWGLTLLSSLLAVAAGYFLMASGDYAGKLVRDHFWGAIVTAGCLLAAGLMLPAGLATRSVAFRRVFNSLLVLTNLALIYTGHQGGSLTHGASFLAEALPLNQPEIEPPKPLEDLLVLEDLILPVLDLRCVSCHNQSKTKSELQLTSYQHLLTGGESGKALLVAGDPDASELVQRISLPPDDDDFMPPEGKTPLKQIEIDLICWWIEAGAQPGMKYENGPEDSSLALQLVEYIPSLQRAQGQRTLDRQAFRERFAAFERAASELGFKTGVDPESDSTLFTVSMQVPPHPIDDNAVAALSRYAAHLGSLSLVASDLSDDALYHIRRMTRLQRLYLASTNIDGSGLVYLDALPELRILNLSHTGLTSAHALHLLRLPALEEAYLFDTRAEPAVLDALRAVTVEQVIRIEEGPFQ